MHKIKIVQRFCFVCIEAWQVAFRSIVVYNLLFISYMEFQVFVSSSILFVQ